MSRSSGEALGYTWPHVAELSPHSDFRSQRERMLAGELYIADDPELARDNLLAMALMEKRQQ